MVDPAFRRLVDSARSVVGGVHGETVTIRPVDRAGGVNGKPVLSATRQAYDCTACFYESAFDASPSVTQPIINAGERIMHRAPGISASVPLSDATPLKTGDMVERSGGRWYEINAINPDDLGGAMLALSKAKAIANA
jgi:hypothetical protein